MPKVTINGRELTVPDGTNVVKAAEAADIEIPHYCYHPGLSVAGNCRMCLVDIRAMSAKQATPLPKLQIACNTVVQEGMVVETDNEKVRAARKAEAVTRGMKVYHGLAQCLSCHPAYETPATIQAASSRPKLTGISSTGTLPEWMWKAGFSMAAAASWPL